MHTGNDVAEAPARIFFYSRLEMARNALGIDDIICALLVSKSLFALCNFR